jgi:membrane protein
MKHMTTQTKETHAPDEPQKTSEAKQVAKKNVKYQQAFWTKFNNDWVMTFAAGLAYNLITAIFPVVIAIIAIAGFIFRSFDPSIQGHLITSIQNAFPSPLNHSDILRPALTTLSNNADFLLLIAVLLAVFGGSRLFVSMEGYFAIIYHTRQRDLIPQNVMALAMLLLFVLLVPLMVFVSSLPALVQSILKATPVTQIPGNGFIFPAMSIVVAWLIAWILFEAIYIVVPNQHISFRNSWRGAVVAAVALVIYLYLFPLYVTHFMGNNEGQIGFVVILLFFFYYFAVILLLGAEINAFVAKGVQSTPDNLPAMVQQLTTHLPTSKKDIQEQAPPSHKNVEPKDVHPESEVKNLENQETQPSQAAQPASFPEHEHIQPTPSNQTNQTQHHIQKNKQKSSSQATSTPFILAEVLAGTALAFAIQFFNLNRKK